MFSILNNKSVQWILKSINYNILDFMPIVNCINEIQNNYGV